MHKKILVTGSFFVNKNHIEILKSAGYDVTHLDLLAVTEDQLAEAIKGISVYIMGGIEQVTNKVIESADKLEAIIFSGVDYDKFIPATELAKQKGIQLLNAPGANAVAVAEFGLGVALLMQRHLLSLSRSGDERFLTVSSFQDSVIGVIGMGNIGSKLIEAVAPFQPKEIIYYNRSAKTLPYRQVELLELLESSDIIFVALPMKAGQVLDRERIEKVKQNSLIVSLSPMNLIDMDALLSRLEAGNIRAAVDWPSPSEEFNHLPLEIWYSTNSHTAYNTHEAVRRVGDLVTAKAIELLAHH
ncbi:MAG: NAD(P)-dependent oxidoreductase [Candidatus Saccharimonas sp.]